MSEELRYNNSYESRNHIRPLNNTNTSAPRNQHRQNKPNQNESFPNALLFRRSPCADGLHGSYGFTA
ncbi:MAG: hypothetical protein ABSG33_05165 [Candidatus Bathyarchaeia archaeon]